MTKERNRISICAEDTSEVFFAPMTMMTKTTVLQWMSNQAKDILLYEELNQNLVVRYNKFINISGNSL